MDSVKNAVNYVAETVQGATAGASKEANKNIAKNDQNTLGTRAEAAKDAISDKFTETSHNGKAEAYKQNP